MTQLRSAIRKTLSALDHAGSPLASQVRAVLRCDDDYASAGKPPCDWDDPQAKDALVSSLVNDPNTLVEVLQDRAMDEQAAAAVADRPQVAEDRVISTVDPEARHTRKSSEARRAGYRAHVAACPETGIITGAADQGRRGRQ